MRTATLHTNRRILAFVTEADSLPAIEKSLGDGYSVLYMPAGDGSIESIVSDPPDAVIVEADYPGHGRFELLSRVLETETNIPVIVAGHDSSIAIDAFRNGAADFLHLPFESGEAAERISDAITRSDRSRKRVHDLITDIEREKKEINDLLKISSSLNASSDSKEMLKRLTDLAADSMNCEAASIMLINQREKVLEFVVATGEKGQRLDTITVPLGEGIAGWVALNGRTQIVNDTSKDERFTGKVDKESGFVTRQILAVPMRIEGETIGVLEVINTRDRRMLGDYDLRVIEGISERIAMVIETVRKIESQQNFYVQITNIIVRAIERKDLYSDGHAWRVAEMCHKIARATNLSDSEKNDLHFGALLHDIGKLDMPSILFNKRTLTDRERELLRQHPVKGAKFLEPIAVWRPIAPFVLYHHEAWDGSGYPFGRSGDSIPLGARIISIAEAFTVMRSMNTYKRQLSLKESVLEIMRCAGKQFDPEIVRVFIGVLEKESSSY